MAKALATHRVTRHGKTSDRPPVSHLAAVTNTPSASPARSRQEPSRGARCQSRERLGDREVGGHEIGRARAGGVVEVQRTVLPPWHSLKYDRAAECLIKDREALLAFYDFPAEHWKHLRLTA
jgi:hypothetical protein